MLKNRILSTLKFFDLQDYPLTLLELHKFLTSDWQQLKAGVDAQGELTEPAEIQEQVKINELLVCLDSECTEEVENFLGFYCLSGRKNLVQQRLRNYYYGFKREKLIRRYINGLRQVPFARGIGLAGSQSMGLQKEFSDIDLLIIVCPGFMWLARTIITAYFQIFGIRRYGQKVANRFCLNHYLAGPKNLDDDRNLYTAVEYAKLRPLVYGHSIWQFQKNNEKWLKIFLPNIVLKEPVNEQPSRMQLFWEKLLANKFGLWLDEQLKNWQISKIRQEKFIVVEADELSFHPNNRKKDLFDQFFKNQ